MSFIAAAVIAGVSGVAASRMSRPKAPPPQQPLGEAYKESLEAQLDLAPELYAAEADPEFGRPAYAQLEAGLTEDALLGALKPPEGTVRIESEDKRWEAYVNMSPDLKRNWERRFGLASVAPDIAAFGKAHYEKRGKNEPHRTQPPEVGSYYNLSEGKEVSREDIPREGGLVELMGSTKPMADGRKPGYDEAGEFQGMTKLGEDLRQQSASAQRTGDISDVSANLTAYQKLMKKSSPETVKQLTAGVTALEDEAKRLGVDTIADPANLQAVAKTLQTGEVDQMTAGVRKQAADIGVGDRGAGERMGGYAQMDDPFELRQTMQRQASEDLSAGRGLSPRQRREAEQSARRWGQAAGRGLDPLAAVREVEELMEMRGAEEDRRRGFAGQVLGQEAGIQAGEMGRGIQQTGFNIQQEVARQEANLGRSLTAQEFNTLQDSARQEANLARSSEAQRYNIGMGEERRTGDIGRELGAAGADITQKMQQEQMNEQLEQRRLQGYLGGIGQVAGMEKQIYGDPLQAIIGRPAGTTGFGMGQTMGAGAGTALSAGPGVVFNPEAGLSYMLGQQGQQAGFAAAQEGAQAQKMAGIFGAAGQIGAAKYGS